MDPKCERIMKKCRKQKRKEVTKKPQYVNVMDNSLLVRFEYVETYKSYVHAAPAFRTVTARKAKGITERLFRPSHRTERSQSESLTRTSDHRHRSKQQRKYGMFLLMQPTVASTSRKILSAKERGSGRNNITNICDRCIRTASERYRDISSYIA